MDPADLIKPTGFPGETLSKVETSRVARKFPGDVCEHSAEDTSGSGVVCGVCVCVCQVGPALMAAPGVTPGVPVVRVYVPAGDVTWFLLDGGLPINNGSGNFTVPLASGEAQLVLLLREGHVLPTQVCSLPPIPYAEVTEQLARSPPTEANRVQSPVGTPEFSLWASYRTMPLVHGPSQRSPVSPALSFRRCPVLTSITLICSQGLAFKSRPRQSAARQRHRGASLRPSDCRSATLPLSCEGTAHYYTTIVIILGGVTLVFSHVEIVASDAPGVRVLSGNSRFPRPCIPALLHTHPTTTSLVVETLMLRAAPFLNMAHLIPLAGTSSYEGYRCVTLRRRAGRTQTAEPCLKQHFPGGIEHEVRQVVYKLRVLEALGAILPADAGGATQGRSEERTAARGPPST
ncbi:hypothetical protein PR048_016164 [Dryococelus australis]|uniref:Uncharacterized protein n=1 Tax=Dryococelus australis TaxID=614101 RepID=A0ABQ9HIY8_9NEOP|nr:hypothetical protein PR048_016164 [Dryococelus australis]